MASATVRYSGHVSVTEDEMLFLLKTIDALEEIGASAQADAIRQLTLQLTRERP